MTDGEELAYGRGQRSAWSSLLSLALGRLEYGDCQESKFAEMVAEREEAVEQLRQVCGEYGDNDWPDNLHLADVIDKHLACHLEKRDEEAEDCG